MLGDAPISMYFQQALWGVRIKVFLTTEEEEKAVLFENR